MRLKLACRALLLACFVVLFASSSFAEEPAPRPARWYGHETLAVDAASLAVMLGGIASNVDPLTYVGAAGYVLATPGLHLAHRRPWRGGASLAMRLVVPAAALAVGSTCSERACTGAVLGGGLLAAPVVDASALAWTPTVSAAKGRMTVGVVGTF